MSECVKFIKNIPQVLENLKIDIRQIKTSIQQYLQCDVIKKYYMDTKRIELPNYSVMENIFSNSMKCKNVAKGNYPVDIISGDIGIDIKMMMVKNRKTNETSLIQNFKTIGSNLDNGNIDIQEWLKTLKSKYDDCNIKKVYFFFVLKENNNINLSITRFHLDRLQNCEIKSIGNKSINIHNIIHPSFGSCKLYKSKKRIELRCDTTYIPYIRLGGYNPLKTIR